MNDKNMEPFYQKYGISEKYGTILLKNTNIVNNLRSSNACKRKIFDYYKYDTFDEYISNICETLIKDEIIMYGGLGSVNEFMCMVFTRLNADLTKRIADDIFKSNMTGTITKFQQIYKCWLYPVDNVGYRWINIVLKYIRIKMN